MKVVASAKRFPLFKDLSDRATLISGLRHMPGLLPECFGACYQVSEPAFVKCVRKTNLRNDTARKRHSPKNGIRGAQASACSD
jgi:hypothetical protein